MGKTAKCAGIAYQLSSILQVSGTSVQLLLDADLIRTEYLGSGVIISTAFVHLLSPAFETLKDPRLGGIWQQFDWAPVLAMTAVFAIFSVELLASRIGSQWLDHLGIE